jgi:hypothetical protein
MGRVFTAVFALILVQGCSLVSREAGYPGGNIGFLADRDALFAKGQRQQVNRYLVTLALLAPLIEETVEGSSEARLSAERIKDLYKKIDQLEKAANRCALPSLGAIPKISEVKVDAGCDKKTVADKGGTALSFESLSFEVSKSLNDALKQAFDNLEIRSNARSVVSLEPTEMLKTILKARHLVPVLLRYLSSYRDVSIIFGLSVADSCAKTEKQNAEVYKAAKEAAGSDGGKLKAAMKDNVAAEGLLSAACDPLAKSFGELINRTRNIDSDLAREERPISAVFKAGEKALNAGLDWQLSEVHRIALLHHVNRACKKLDALARIEDAGFKGCSIPLDDSDDKSKSDEPTSKAVEGILENAPS